MIHILNLDADAVVVQEVMLLFAKVDFYWKYFNKGLVFKKNKSTRSSEYYLCPSLAGVGASDLSISPSLPLFVTRDHHIIYIKHTIKSWNLNSFIRCLVGITSSNSTWSNPNRRLLWAWLELKPLHLQFCYNEGLSSLDTCFISTDYVNHTIHRYELYNCPNDNLASIEASAKSHYQVFE